MKLYVTRKDQLHHQSPQSKQRVQQAEEGLPYLHLTYFILWESSILKAKERKKNCWGGLLAAGWTAVFKERDKWEISTESTKRVNSLFIFSPHKVSSFWNDSCHDHFPTSRPLLLFQCFPESPRGSLCRVLIFPPQIGTCKYLHFWSFAAYAFFLFLIIIIIIINSAVAVLCSLLQFRYLMRAAGTERWPVFVCLWAKRHWLCCVRLSWVWSAWS